MRSFGQAALVCGGWTDPAHRFLAILP